MENTNYPLQDQIQALIAGEADDNTKKDLANQAASDPTIASELSFSKSLALALKNQDMIAANLILGSVIDAEGFPLMNTQSFWQKWGNWIAGSVLAVFVCTAGLYLAEQKGMFITENERLFQAFASPLENVFFLPQDGSQAVLKQGMDAYDTGQYASAAKSFETYMATQPDNAVGVYLGVSHLLSGSPALALVPLKEASKSVEPPIKEAAMWYLALSHLSLDNPEEARRVLATIPQDGIFSEKVKELLTNMPEPSSL